MPMGKKIRHYEKQKALFPFPFSFLSKQIHKYEKKSQGNPADCTTFIQNKGGCAGEITIDLGFRSRKLRRIVLNLKNKQISQLSR